MDEADPELQTHQSDSDEQSIAQIPRQRRLIGGNDPGDRRVYLDRYRDLRAQNPRLWRLKLDTGTTTIIFELEACQTAKGGVRLKINFY